jgi:hypothetical protein
MVHLPLETDTILIVDPDAVLPPTIAMECFQPVSRWHGKFTNFQNPIDLIQFALGNSPKLPWTRFPGGLCVSTVVYVFGSLIPE